MFTFIYVNKYLHLFVYVKHCVVEEMTDEHDSTKAGDHIDFNFVHVKEGELISDDDRSQSESENDCMIDNSSCPRSSRIQKKIINQDVIYTEDKPHSCSLCSYKCAYATCLTTRVVKKTQR